MLYTKHDGQFPSHTLPATISNGTLPLLRSTVDLCGTCGGLTTWLQQWLMLLRLGAWLASLKIDRYDCLFVHLTAS